MATQATHFEFDGFAEIDEKLQCMSIGNAEIQKRIREATWQVLADVRKAAAENANFRDSRHNSIQAIRRTVFKKILGGSVSILDKKARKSRGTGGSDRTKDINSYQGSDRAFILRFVNSGTRDRYAGNGRNNRMGGAELRAMKGKPGYRGLIEPMNFFAPAAKGAIQKAAKNLASMIENEIFMQQWENGDIK